MSATGFDSIFGQQRGATLAEKRRQQERLEQQERERAARAQAALKRETKPVFIKGAKGLTTTEVGKYQKRIEHELNNLNQDGFLQQSHIMNFHHELKNENKNYTYENIENHFDTVSGTNTPIVISTTRQPPLQLHSLGTS
jgi:hypothetical protein